MFYCANSVDSIQSFGVIQPGANVSRQWLIAVNLSLSQLAQQTIAWKWSCDSLQSVAMCEHKIQPVLGEPTRVVLSPWKLRFRAEQNKALPASQQVELYDAASAGIAWQLQSSTPWIDFTPANGTQTTIDFTPANGTQTTIDFTPANGTQTTIDFTPANGTQTTIDFTPANGTQTTSVSVRPNTTAMPVAVYNGAIGITPVLLVSPQASIEIEYEISLISPTAQPNATSLSQNYPNPVSGEQRIVIGFSMEKDGYASIKLYDMLGRFVATVFEGNAQIGAQRVWFNASSLRPGMYTYVLTAGERMFSKRMLVR
jgi:hypothetical protein